MVSEPGIILKSNDLPKESLITLLKNDELNMDEGEIWLSVIQWAIKQVPGLVNDPTSWSSSNVNTIKDIIAECIPHIRFFNISYEEVVEKVIPYDDLLPSKLRHEIHYYHYKKNYKPTTSMLPPRMKQGYDNQKADKL